MTWKRLSFVIMALGILLMLWVGGIYFTNQRLTSERAGIRATYDDASNFLENRRRDESRKSAMYLAIGGTVVLFAGIGFRVVTDKK